MSSIDDSLTRLSEALGKKQNEPPQPPDKRGGPGELATALGILAITLIVAAAATHNKFLLALAMVFAAIGGGIFVARNSAEVRKLMGEGGVGMGATVDASAVVEPGATIEMGAMVSRGAQIKKGARVRMGASVGRDAILEPGAIVSWGAMVERGAHVGAAAIVGAGATVSRNARVPPGMRVSPGAIWGGGGPALPQAALPKPSVHNRAAAICDRLESDLRDAPDNVREFLGTSPQAIGSLRTACEDLARREQAMRAESEVARLDEERAALEKRAAAESDPGLKQSLSGAIAAIDELKRQRELLRVGADRLEAEQSRLVYTLEGISSQLVRLRASGPGAVPGALQQGLTDLRDRIDAISDALEQVSREAPAAMRELAVPPPDDRENPGALDKKRDRQQN